MTGMIQRPFYRNPVFPNANEQKHSSSRFAHGSGALGSQKLRISNSDPCLGSPRFFVLAVERTRFQKLMYDVAE